MDQVKLLSAFVVLLSVLLLMANSPVTMVSAETSESLRFLVQPEDLESFGEVSITSPLTTLSKRDLTDPKGQSWDRAQSIAISVMSPKPGEYTAELISSSFEYSSPQAAQAKMETIAEGDEEFSGDLSLNVSLLDTKLLEAIVERGINWQAASGIDSEGFVNDFLYLQAGSKIARIHLTSFSSTITGTYAKDASVEEQIRVYQEALTKEMQRGTPMDQLIDQKKSQAFSREILNHVVSEMIADNKPKSKTSDQMGQQPRNSGEPRLRATHFVHQQTNGNPCGAQDSSADCHHLVTWGGRPNGHEPQYHGVGGYWATCITTHFCIGNWSWWLQNPESRLGVPKTFYFPQTWGGSQNPYNYSAIVN